MSGNTLTPAHGDIYEAIEDFNITYRTIFLGPFTSGGEARFPAGEQLIIDTCGRHSIKVYCDAVNYRLLEELIVPEKTRTSINYDGYYFHFAIAVLQQHCRKILPH
ncbi:MAG: hypothetical protein JW863_17480 [Chitinispirillaceae bacterium]|nr:hypothetical protein [Chitinispirillaceae bacterium]